MIPIYTVCTGPNYNPGHVKRFHKQLQDHVNLPLKLHCYTTYDKSEFDECIEVIPIEHDDGRRQWHKVDIFNMAPQGQPCFTSDLDWTFVGDVTDIFKVQVDRNELVAPYRWWTRFRGDGYTINGGLYKFIGGEFTYIPEVFHKNPQYWMRRYIIDLQIALPPVNGEQNFMEEIVCKHGGVIKYFEPRKAIGRKPNDRQRMSEYNELYYTEFKEDWLWLGGEFNPAIRMIQSII
jgi:hypothetical protein